MASVPFSYQVSVLSKQCSIFGNEHNGYDTGLLMLCSLWWEVAYASVCLWYNMYLSGCLHWSGFKS